MDTKKKLLDAAEQLFAENGFAATSLRDITSLAGTNLASVNYHFGSKEALLEAVFQRRLQPLNEERLAMLDAYQADAGDDAIELPRILWAFLAPAFRRLHKWDSGDQRFMQLIGRVYSAPSQPSGKIFVHQFEAAKNRFQAAFQKALPHLSSDEVLRRMHHVIAAMAHTASWGRAFCCLQSVEAPETDVVLHSIVSFAEAGMRAPEGEFVAPKPVPATALPGASS